MIEPDANEVVNILANEIAVQAKTIAVLRSQLNVAEGQVAALTAAAEVPADG